MTITSRIVESARLRRFGSLFAFENDKVEKASRAYTLLMSADPAIHEAELGALLM